MSATAFFKGLSFVNWVFFVIAYNNGLSFELALVGDLVYLVNIYFYVIFVGLT